MPSHTIAVVDDDAAFREMMAEVLTDEGYVPHLCADMSNAMDSIQHASPNAVLLDLWLNNDPRAGLHLLEQLRDAQPTAQTSVVVTSGNTRLLETEQPRLQELNAAVVPKPFDLDEMMTTIQEVVR